MKSAIITLSALVVAIAVYAAGPAGQDDWYVRHPMPEGMRSLVEGKAVDAVKVCKDRLSGKDQKFVRNFLGVSDLNHGEDEYIYHLERKNGSMWMLLIEFDGDKVCDIYGEEMWPPEKRPPNQKIEPAPR